MIETVKDHVSNILSPYKSDPLRSLHLAATNLHKIGVLNEDDLKRYDTRCLKRKRIMTPRKKKVFLAITAISLALKMVELVRVYRNPTRG